MIMTRPNLYSNKQVLLVFTFIEWWMKKNDFTFKISQLYLRKVSVVNVEVITGRRHSYIST